MRNIKRLCGLSDPDHFQQQSHESTRGSLRQIIPLHPYFEHNCFQGGESLRETQPICKHFHRGDFCNSMQRNCTLCAPAAQPAQPSFLFCLPLIILSKLRGGKKHGHERIWLSGFGKSLKNSVPSTRIEVGLSSWCSFKAEVQDTPLSALPTKTRMYFWENKQKKRLYSLSQTVDHT